MMNVALMTRLIFMPMSCAVSKSLDTARMAMPIFVKRMSSTSAATRTIVSTGVIRVTRFVVAPNTVTMSESHGIAG